MLPLFLTCSGENDREARALSAWLTENGWQGPILATPSGTQEELASGCAVVFLLSRASLADAALRAQFQLARKLGKHVLVALIDTIQSEDLPDVMRGASPVVALAPAEGQGATTHGETIFSTGGLTTLKADLAQSRIDPLSFNWTPEQEGDASCYRGLKPLGAADAGIFFGRDAALLEALDSIRSLADGRRGGVFVLLGGAGAGKTSFLGAGLAPRLAREGDGFVLLPVLRPGPGGLFGPDGLAQAIAAASGAKLSEAQAREAIQGGAESLRPLLKTLVEGARDGKLVIAVDQAEDLFVGKNRDESAKLLTLLGALSEVEDPRVLVIYSIRANAFESLQRAASLPHMRTKVFALPSPTRAELESIIEGPLKRLGADRNAFRIEPELVKVILDDMQAAPSNPLPVLAFVLEQLLRARRPDSAIDLSDYKKIGGVSGCIDAAANRVLGVSAIDQPPPADYDIRVSLLRRGLIPWLAGFDALDETPRRRVAAAREIPVTSLPLIERLEQERLARRVLLKDSQEPAYELAHDALFEHWKLLKTFIAEEPRLGVAVEGLKQASRDWEKRGRSVDAIAHSGAELEKAEHIYAQPDVLALLDSTDRAYLVACREKEKQAEKDRPPQVPAVEIDPRLVERSFERPGRSRRSSGFAWVGMLAALSLAGFAGWNWRLMHDEKSVADARLARAEASIETAIASSNKVINELAQKLATANGEQAKLVRDLASQVSDMQERLDEEEAVSGKLRRTQSVGLNVVAAARLANGDTSRALAAAQKSVLLMQKLTSSDAGNVGWRRDLSVSYETLGDAQLAAKDIDGALASYRADLTIAKTLASSAPDNPQWRWDMSVSYEKLGDALVAKGELDKALQAYGDSRALREALLATNPKNRLWERALAVSYERMGAALAQRRDAAGATAAFEGALEIYQRMARADPGDVQTLVSSIVPRWRLAGLDRPRAREHLSPALEILEKLAAEGRLADDKRDWLARVKTELAALDQPPAATP